MIRLLVFFIFVSSFSFSQLEFEKLMHDFGNLSAESDLFVDIAVKNIGKKKEYFLSFRKPLEVVCLSKGQFILPDSTSFVRIQVNSQSKGKFSHEIEIYTSDRQEATKIKVKGNVLELPNNPLANLQSCPDFNVRPTKNNTSNKLTVKTIDKESRQTIDAKVFLIQNGIDITEIKTKNGLWKDKYPLGFTYFFAKPEGYKALEIGAYVNHARNEIVLEFEKDPSYCLPVPVEFQKITPKKDSIVEVEIVEHITEEKLIEKPRAEEDLNLILKNIPTTKSDSLPNSPLEFPLDNFDSTYFKPINVVFVLDVSSSMGTSDKFDLLKFSLMQLSGILRKEDKISFVTYSNEASVLLETTSGIERELVKKKISELKAFGYTAGSAGIKWGYKQASKSFIEDGTNLVIVITDGAFNKYEGDYLKMIAKNQEKGILLSVVGIKNLPKDEENMKEAAEKGKGNYVPVFKLADAQENLIYEIKKKSYRF
jgi:Ca-activated chloride channel family protein